MNGKILTGHSLATDASVAVAELDRQVRQPELALLLFFCSPAYDLAVVTAEMNRRFPDTVVVGCTTAGEIGPAGYRGQSMTGMSFPGKSCAAVACRVDDLNAFEIARGRELAQGLLQKLEAQRPTANASNTFGFLVVDGMSMREEPVTHALQDGLGGIRMFGGSAGDDLRFERTWVFGNGEFRGDSAVLTLVSMDIPFKVIKTQHFVSGDERMVVTEVDAPRRIVKEINGLPAVEEYARIVGVPPEQLTADHFAAWPVVVMIDGTDFVRSIQHANSDGSLSFYCAIDEGVVLRVARGQGMLENLQSALAGLERDLGGIQGMLVCDCILRSLEAQRDGIRDEVGELFRRHHAVGFSTYGEQFGGVHINQTLTAIAFGEGAGGDD
jgi:hypothetical protein